MLTPKDSRIHQRWEDQMLDRYLAEQEGCPECDEKDERIEELEAEVERLGKHIEGMCLAIGTHDCNDCPWQGCQDRE